jgi:ABC-type antimicrobial peptide transport system permease subunit
MKNQLTERGNDIIDRISLSTNATITTPLMTSLKETDMMKIFLNNTMITIVFFLGLLCVQLVYSLMLSDVEEKTYTYGMLRALGF